MKDYIVIPLKELLSSGEFTEDFLLSKFQEFECEIEDDLESFLRYKALTREQNLTSSTYLFVDEKEFIQSKNLIIYAFVSLANTSINIDQLSQKQRRRIIGSTVDNRDAISHLPVFLIGQLGRDEKYSSTDLSGTLLLYEAISIIKSSSSQLSGDLVLLECRPKMYDKFYKDKGFNILPSSHEDDGDGFYTDLILQFIKNPNNPKMKKYFKEKYGAYVFPILEEMDFTNHEKVDDLLAVFSDAKKRYVQLLKEIKIPDENLLTLYARVSKFEFT